VSKYQVNITMDVEPQEGHGRGFFVKATLTFQCESWAAKQKAERMVARYTRELIAQNGYKSAWPNYTVEWVGNV